MAGGRTVRPRSGAWLWKVVVAALIGLVLASGASAGASETVPLRVKAYRGADPAFLLVEANLGEDGGNLPLTVKFQRLWNDGTWHAFAVKHQTTKPWGVARVWFGTRSAAQTCRVVAVFHGAPGRHLNAALDRSAPFPCDGEGLRSFHDTRVGQLDLWTGSSEAVGFVGRLDPLLHDKWVLVKLQQYDGHDWADYREPHWVQTYAGSFFSQWPKWSDDGVCRGAAWSPATRGFEPAKRFTQPFIGC